MNLSTLNNTITRLEGMNTPNLRRDYRVTIQMALADLRRFMEHDDIKPLDYLAEIIADKSELAPMFVYRTKRGDVRYTRATSRICGQIQACRIVGTYYRANYADLIQDLRE